MWPPFNYGGNVVEVDLKNKGLKCKRMQVSKLVRLARLISWN